MNKIYLKDNSYLYYDKGKIDKWCVYLVKEDGTKTAPRDIEYFEELYKYSEMFGKERIYSDFIKIYDRTTKQPEYPVVALIKEISLTYKDYSDDIFRTFSTIYLAMISEENRKATRLGKRIKRLGIHYLLVKSASLKYSSTFMIGMSWDKIDELCKACGF